MGNVQELHPHSLEVDEWIHRSEQVGQLAMGLKETGLGPGCDVGPPRLGRSLLLRQVFPSTPLVIWPELWLRPEHMGINDELNVGQMQYLRIKDWLIDGAMADASLAVLPTQYQASTFPQRWQHKIAVVHEGVPEAMLQTATAAAVDDCRGHHPWTLTYPVVTFISRNLEPMRGFPTFMRALPSLLKNIRQFRW